ncbi:MAG: 6-carboxytetrahydropterin synthase QueD [Candidatus Omnitrophota bacterium]|jgi:6-pyruvoyltetrahydropterin/6-carboxytetrahydropterin synthase|nr:MAG: 6-carboxytetrahydropterin synthase QueD [Candidatus Omnitrophota bacterium]
MFSIKVEGYFSSAHNLRAYYGKCEELHGHNWKVEVVIASKTLDKIGMLMDFKIIKAELNRVLDKLDHKYLNETPYFKKINPTSENIAKFIYDALIPKFKKLKSVTVWENHTCCATYER